MRLQGKTALVTGSTSGIGQAIAEAFAREGARVVVSGVSVTEIPPSNAMEFGAILASSRLRSRMAGFARLDQGRSVSFLHFC